MEDKPVLLRDFPALPRIGRLWKVLRVCETDEALLREYPAQLGGGYYLVPSSALTKRGETLRAVAESLLAFCRQTTGHAKRSSLAAAISFARQASVPGDFNLEGNWQNTARGLWLATQPYLVADYARRVEFDLLELK